MRLTFKEFIQKFFGFVVNEGSREIHNLKYKHQNCHHDMMKNKNYITKKTALKKLKGTYDGCKYCWIEKNTG